MPYVLYIWWIILHLPDTVYCTMWTDATPGLNEISAACGVIPEGYRMEVVSIYERRIACNLPASEINGLPGNCGGIGKLDDYSIEIIKPAHDEVACAVTVRHEGPPFPAEVQEVCGPELLEKVGNGSARLEFYRQETVEPPAPVCERPTLLYGPGLYEQPSKPASLWTDEPLYWLAGRLIWYGYVTPHCDGYSGLDPVTLAPNACGMQAARAAVTVWQNQYNDAIYTASQAHQVPARLLKRMILAESQAWPLYTGASGERGVLQVTSNGADVLLRYDPDLSPYYTMMTADMQAHARWDILQEFDCPLCDVTTALDHTLSLLPLYARLLAAYRCRAVSIDPSLTGADAWRQAIADYNGSQTYLMMIEKQ